MSEEDRINILKIIRQETGCGLADASIGFDKLLEALKNKPMLIMDKPSTLKITWE